MNELSKADERKLRKAFEKGFDNFFKEANQDDVNKMFGAQDEEIEN